MYRDSSYKSKNGDGDGGSHVNNGDGNENDFGKESINADEVDYEGAR